MLGTRFLMLLLFLAGPLRIGSVTWTPEAVDPENRTGRVVLEYVLDVPAEEMEGLYVQISFTKDNIFYWKDGTRRRSFRPRPVRCRIHPF